MTYNFDPDRWYENHLTALEARRGALSEADYERELADLERRFDDMQERLEGTYQLPTTKPD